MLATTLTLYGSNGITPSTFTKVAESQRDGSLFRKAGSSARCPDVLVVKATFAKPGPVGSDRVLVQRVMNYQPLDVNSAPVGKPLPVIVNITLSIPRAVYSMETNPVPDLVAQACSAFLGKDGTATGLGANISSGGLQLINGEL